MLPVKNEKSSLDSIFKIGLGAFGIYFLVCLALAVALVIVGAHFIAKFW